MTDAVRMKPVRGRPRDPGKRQALVDAATRLFLEHGSKDVSLDQLIAAAGVSRATLYNNFPDKAALLTAVIAEQSQRIAADDEAEASRSSDVEVVLTAFGDRFMRFVALPSTFAFERLIGQAALEDPEHGRRYFEAGPARVRRILAAIIQRGQDAGTLRPADTERAADDLIGLWQGTWRLEVAYGGRSPPDDAALQALSRHGVRQFLALYAVR